MTCIDGLDVRFVHLVGILCLLFICLAGSLQVVSAHAHCSVKRRAMSYCEHLP